jgi:hypothetical protein
MFFMTEPSKKYYVILKMARCKKCSRRAKEGNYGFCGIHRKDTKKNNTRKKDTRKKDTRKKDTRKKNTKIKRDAKKKSYAGRGTVKTSAIVKKTKSGGYRLSARAAYNGGWKIGSRTCYDGKCKTLKLRPNSKSPYWG